MRERGSDGDWFSVESVIYYDQSQIRTFAYVRREDGSEIPDGEYDVPEGLDAPRRRWRKWNINELVRFKLRELTKMKEGVICVIDQHDYWDEGGSRAEYLRSTSPGTDPESKIQFVEYKRIHWMQKA